MKYRFEKKIVYDVEADSLDDARGIMKINDFESYFLKDVAQEELEDSIGSWSIGLDIDEDEVFAMMDCCDVEILDSEYVGENSKNDPEKRLYNHLTDKTCPAKTVWVLRNSDDDGIFYGVFSSVEKAKECAVEDFNSYFPNEEGKITDLYESFGIINFSVKNSKKCTNYDIEDFPIDWEK